MEDRQFVEADPNFVQEIKELGGESLKKCFQCGTCSVVCELSPTEKPFPRKEMIWAQWGLKDRLMKDPDIWMCHQCTDCSSRCPRGAKPGDVLAALRSYSVIHFSRPKFLGKALSSPKYLPAILLVPAIIMFAYLWLTGTRAFPVGEISPEELVPSLYTYIAMGIVLVFMFFMAGSGTYRLWKNLGEFRVNPEPSMDTGNSQNSLVSLLIDILKHNNFGKCQENRVSRYTHLSIFYGSILLIIATALSAVFNHFFAIYSPHPLISPVKIAGNVGAVLLLAGCVTVIFRRLSAGNSPGKAAYFDWFLIWTLFFATLTGIATEVIRLSGMATATYWVYLVHLWLMFMFFIYLPFSKAAHMAYRTVAMYYARRIGRSATASYTEKISRPVAM
jgi:quinone-modifying oxidoreductase subunit QmoC